MAGSTTSPANMRSPPCATRCPPHLKLAPREVEARIAFVMSGGTEGVLSPHITVFARSQRPEEAARKVPERQAPQRRHRPYSRFPARGDRPGRADRRNAKCSRSGDARRPHRRHERRPFRPDQMPLAEQRPRHGGSGERQDRSHRERLCVDGLFARRLGDRGRQGAGRGRRRRRTSGPERELGASIPPSRPVPRESSSCTMS